ncbi:hypothetical protein P3T76_012722 [Phytophthora citrophthora]|uniref:Uncharacterized protein n=1 Tax=Phytophthora citrophthora TaxID=4793 RepID=A0AAD9LCY1_9STRA|nr:hypothetical protein P3T76_012722 [Phytophthora citrophthora]
MDKYELILGMPCLEKHEPWIDWRGKAIGASRPAVSDRALVNHVPTSVRTKSVRWDRQDAAASEDYLEAGVVDATSPLTRSDRGPWMAETTGGGPCPTCGFATTAASHA